MSTTFAPWQVPKLSRGWVQRLAAGLRSGAFAESGLSDLGAEANIDLPQLAEAFVEPDGHFLLDPHEGNASSGEAFVPGSRFGLVAYLAAFASANAEAPQHLCIRGSQGTGKTSLLVMLALARLSNPHLKPSKFRYVALGPDALQRISVLPDQANTVLLLDGLDEEPQSFGRAADRLGELVQASRAFRKVIVAADLASVPLVLGPRGGRFFTTTDSYAFPVVAMAPFDEAEIAKYLIHSFGSGDPRCKQLLAKLLAIGPVFAKPIFLRFSDDLLRLELDHWYEYGILAGLVEARIRTASLALASDANAHRDLVQSCMSFAIDSHRRRTELESEPAGTTRLSESVADALVASGILHSVGSELRFVHLALQSFFVAKSLIDGERPSAAIRPTSDVMAHIQSWLSWPSGAAGRAGLEWSRLDLSRSDLADWNLSDTNMQGATLEESNLVGADFARSDLRRTRLCGAKLTGANLADTDCESADFSHADLSETSFSGARLRGTTLRAASLRGALISRADLEGADFRGADLAGVRFHQIQYDASTRWPEGFDPTQVPTAYP